MKNWLMILFLGLGTIGFGCSEPTSTENEEGKPEATEASDPTENEEQAPATESDVLASGDQYEIKMLDAEPKSPRKEMSGTADGVQVMINYGSPQIKGREIWGGLEAYGEVWRSGANEATTFTIDQDAMIGGIKVPAGTYGFFTIPQEGTDWTVILNEVADQWGAGKYDAEKDVARFEVTPVMTEEVQEELEYMIEDDQVVLAWEKVQIPFSVEAAEAEE